MGLLVVFWFSGQVMFFSGNVLMIESFGIVVEFTSTRSNDKFFLVNVYGPCDGSAREDFVAWLCHLDIEDEAMWLFVGDFNFYRYAENRNREGANIQDICTFNEVISYLDLIELPIKGRSYTWRICRWIL
jgi:hypothetical protein